MNALSPIIWLSLLIGALALVCLIVSLRYLRRKRLIDDLPTSKTQGVFIGQCELKGTAESDEPFTSYLAGRRCVLYKWTVQEHWSRTTVHMTSKGPQSRRESGWEEVAKGGKSAPFYLKDDTGVIRIQPKGAKLYTTILFEKECTRKNPLYYDKGPDKAVANSTHRRRFHEIGIPLHANLYVTGYSRERADVVAPEIAQDKKASLFVIATRSEKQIGRRYVRWFWFWAVLGLLIALGIGLYCNWGRGYSSSVIYWLTAGGYLLVFGLGWLWMVYNSLVRLYNRAQQGWSQIEVQLKRRADLIPRLVECVMGYQSHERGIQTAVAELRSQAQAAPDMAHAIGTTLIALSERYPELKAGESFQALQQELASTEQRIALARAYFNDVATFYNTRLETIPDRFVAALARLKLQALWQAESFERAPVKVALSE
ncbi:MAG: LemA family protein [Dehalococcoidia bacterium]|nr:LemA family protein [Dehalococcoidia bacterium]